MQPRLTDMPGPGAKRLPALEDLLEDLLKHPAGPGSAFGASLHLLNPFLHRLDSAPSLLLDRFYHVADLSGGLGGSFRQGPRAGGYGSDYHEADETRKEYRVPEAKREMRGLA